MEALLDPATSLFALVGDDMAAGRLSVYREFLASEFSYICDLKTLSEVYEEPFLKDLKKKTWLLSESEIQLIFGNYKELLQVWMKLPRQ